MSDATATLGPAETAAELDGTGFVHLDGVLYVDLLDPAERRKVLRSVTVP